MANLVLDSSKTKLDLDDKNSYCPCCNLPYPQEEDFFSVFVDNMELGVLGSGFPLFFALMQMLIFYCLIVCLTFTYPIGKMIMEYNAKLEGEGYFIESKVAMFSYGAFVVGAEGIKSTDGTDPITKEKFFEDAQNNINSMAEMFYGTCAFSFFYFIFMRWRLYNLAEELNAKALTPADYCIAAFTGQDFSDCGDSQVILEEVKEVFEDRFQKGSKVQYINAAYNIQTFYEVSERFNELNKDIAMIEYYISQRKTEKDKETGELENPDYNEDTYKEECESEKQPRGFPSKKTGFCKKEPISLEASRAELEEV